ncbi:MAG: hypothetical protein RLZZ511_1825 [Cyanobacteriota bacterium]|jgi:hypothetical protein
MAAAITNGPRYSAEERQARADFILSRLSRGFNNRSVHRQFAQEFQCSTQSASNWRRWAIRQMVEDETAETRRGNYAIALEIRHDQIVTYQNELVEIQKEIKRVGDILDQRDRLLQAMQSASGKRLQDLKTQLDALPKIGLTTRATLIESKTRIRERMYSVIVGLSQLQGISGDTDWERALNTLMDRGILPSQLALEIRDKVEAFHANFAASGPTLDELDPDIFDATTGFLVAE